MAVSSRELDDQEGEVELRAAALTATKRPERGVEWTVSYRSNDAQIVTVGSVYTGPDWIGDREKDALDTLLEAALELLLEETIPGSKWSPF